MNEAPRFNTLSFGDGFRWLGRAAELMAQGGTALITVAAVFVLVSLIQFLPFLGAILFTIISPLLTAGLITVFRLVEEGQRPVPATLFAGWRELIGSRLLLLGGWLLVGFLIAFAALLLWLMPQMDMNALDEVMQDPNVMANSPEQVISLFQGVNLFGGLAISLIILAVVLGGLYFAVPLVHFWEWPVASALLWSLRAMLMNWRPFLAFGLMFIGVVLAAAFMFGIVIGILSLALGPLGDLISQVLVVIASLFFQLLVAATQWVAFNQIFDASGPGSDLGSGDDGDGDSGSIEI